MAFDPISAAITGGLALIDMQGKKEASKTAQAQLAETKRMNADMLRMAQAGQTDAFGNRFTFNDALNEWLTKLTPEQQSLISAGEREQRLGLTEDAGRNRGIREMQARTGRQAGDMLSQALTRYASGGPSEESTRSTLTRLLSQSTPDVGARRDVTPSGVLISGGQQGTPIQRLAKILLQSRQGALAETGQREGQRQQRDLGGIGQLASLMGGGQTNINMPGTADSIDAKQNALSNRQLQTQQGAIGNIQGPYANAVKTADTMPGLRDIASLYAALNRSTTNKTGTGAVRNLPNLTEPIGKSSLGPSPSSLSTTQPFSSWMDSTKHPWSLEQSWF